MAKQIIIQNVGAQIGGEMQVNVIFWFPVAAGKEYPRNGATSFYGGASPSEISDIQAGRVIEDMRTYVIPANFTKAQAQAFLKAAYDSRLTYLSTRPSPGEFYGISYDGLAWSA